MAATVVATKRLAKVFRIVSSPQIRKTLFLWVNIAVLATLLEEIGWTIPLGTYIFSTSEDQLAFFRQLLNWYGDAPLYLDMDPKSFTEELLSRKDQPLLVEDSGRLNHAVKNLEILEGAMVTGEVSLKTGHNTVPIPLQAPLTILSCRVSALSCAPEMMTIDVHPEDIDREMWLQLENISETLKDYIRAFTCFASAHLSDLQAALKAGYKRALQMSNGELNQTSSRMLGIMYAMKTFLGGFFHACELEDAMAFLCGENDEDLIALLRMTSEKENRASVPEQFIAIVREYLSKGILFSRPKDHYDATSENLVLYDDKSLWFTPPAFRIVCEALAQSRPTVLNGLAEVGLLCGKPVNSSTRLTRISAYNVHGIRQTVKVYGLCRAPFEELGDPLVLADEGR